MACSVLYYTRDCRLRASASHMARHLSLRLQMLGFQRILASLVSLADEVREHKSASFVTKMFQKAIKGSAWDPSKPRLQEQYAAVINERKALESLVHALGSPTGDPSSLDGTMGATHVAAGEVNVGEDRVTGSLDHLLEPQDVAKSTAGSAHTSGDQCVPLLEPTPLQQLPVPAPLGPQKPNSVSVDGALDTTAIAESIRRKIGLTPAPIFALDAIDATAEALLAALAALKPRPRVAARGGSGSGKSEAGGGASSGSGSGTARLSLSPFAVSVADAPGAVLELGRGSYGTVVGVLLRPYGDVPVALKLFKDGESLLADAAALARIKLEAAIHYSLRGRDGIVTMHGLLIDEERGLLGLLMERCGASLDQLIYPQTPLTPVTPSPPSPSPGTLLPLGVKIDILLQVRGTVHGVEP